MTSHRTTDVNNAFKKKSNLNTATEPEVISNGDKLHKEEDVRRRK